MGGSLQSDFPRSSRIATRWEGFTCKGQGKEVDNKEMTETKKEEEKEGNEVKDESLPEDFCCPKPTGRT